MDKQRNAIGKIFETDKHPWPRGGLRLWPSITRWQGDDSFKQIEDIREVAKLNIDLYLNVFSNDQKDSNEYDKIFLDVDSEEYSIPKAYMKLIIICKKLRDNGVPNYTILFSGSKGFHIYIRHKTIHLANYRDAILGWAESIGILRQIDASAIEPNRVARIPYSKNSKGGTCIPLGNNEKIRLDDMKESEDWEFKENENLHLTLKKFDKSAKTSGRMSTKSAHKVFSSREYYPECMGQLYDEAMNGVSLGHAERVELGKFLMFIHGDIENAKIPFTRMSDYKERVTDYQLRYLSEKGYKMMNCQSMEQNGLCPLKDPAEECAFFPSINHYLKDD